MEKLTAILNQSWQSGLTLTAEVFFGGALVDSLPMTEAGSTAVYSVDFEPEQSGEYSWRAVDADGDSKWTGEFTVTDQPAEAGGLVQTITLTNAGNGLAIEGAIIRYSQAGVTKDTAVTNAEGVAEIAVPTGTYSRTVIAGGFDALADTAVVTADADVDLELIVAATGATSNVGPGLAN